MMIDWQDAQTLREEAAALRRALEGDGDLIDVARAAADLMESTAAGIEEDLHL